MITELRNVVDRGIPDDRPINRKVSVCDEVAQASCFRPRDLWIAELQFVRKISDSLSDDRKLKRDGALQERVAEKPRAIQIANEYRDLCDCIEDIAEVQLVTVHR